MAIDDGYSRYSCDVASCKKAKYTKPGTAAAAEYVTRSWTDANAQQRTATLCREHAQAFDAMRQGHDADMAAFLMDGTVKDGMVEAESEAEE